MDRSECTIGKRVSAPLSNGQKTPGTIVVQEPKLGPIRVYLDTPRTLGDFNPLDLEPLAEDNLDPRVLEALDLDYDFPFPERLCEALLEVLFDVSNRKDFAKRLLSGDPAATARIIANIEAQPHVTKLCVRIANLEGHNEALCELLDRTPLRELCEKHDHRRNT